MKEFTIRKGKRVKKVFAIDADEAVKEFFKEKRGKDIEKKKDKIINNSDSKSQKLKKSKK